MRFSIHETRAKHWANIHFKNVNSKLILDVYLLSQCLPAFGLRLNILFLDCCRLYLKQFYWCNSLKIFSSLSQWPFLNDYI